jgi:hypothetical protein
MILDVAFYAGSLACIKRYEPPRCSEEFEKRKEERRKEEVHGKIARKKS